MSKSMDINLLLGMDLFFILSPPPLTCIIISFHFTECDVSIKQLSLLLKITGLSVTSVSNNCLCYWKLLVWVWRQYQTTVSVTENYWSECDVSIKQLSLLLKITGLSVTSVSNNCLCYWKLLVWVWCQTHYDVAYKNNNVSFEDLSTDVITSIPTRPIRLACDTSNYVCLDIHNCRYFINLYAKSHTIYS